MLTTSGGFDIKTVHANHEFRQTADGAGWLLDNWRLIVGRDEDLTMQAMGPCLSAADMQLLCEQLFVWDTDSFAEIIFDFGLVEQVTSPWTPVFAAMVLLARELGRPCHVVALHGQPAAMAELLLGGCQLSVLTFTGECSRFRRKAAAAA